jgi:predicted RNA-binding protein with PUA-like domain
VTRCQSRVEWRYDELMSRPAAWLLKSDPESYSYEDLLRDRRTAWDGVSNPQALLNIRAMTLGAEVFIYHSGAAKAIVGLAKVVRAAYPDGRRGEKFVVVDLEASRPLAAPVTLASLKTLPVFATSPLLRQGRLSVVPLTAAQVTAIHRLAGR